jgi:DNA-binding response OmpR family regulator
VIRRKKFTGHNKVQFNEIVINTISKQAEANNKILELTRKEYQLLLYFIVNKGKVISKNAIAQHLWADQLDPADSFNFIYTHIKNLRKKLQEAGTVDYIKAIYGMGYKFTDS